MKVEDKRERSSWVPAVQILEQIISLIPKDQLVGIRNIVLLDRDYHKSGGAAGRYVAIPRTRTVDIEMYLENYCTLPPVLQSNRIFLTFTLALTLTHEIYHHLVRGERRFRKPTDKLEETKAAQWSQQQSKAILLKLFPKDRCRNEIDEFSRLWDEVWLKSDRRI